MDELKNRPIDIIDFTSDEQKNFMISFAKLREEIDILSHIQGLYNASMGFKELGADEVIIFQLLHFTHYQFLYATSAFLRCHLNESFMAARAAIDSALNASWIINDKSTKQAYLDRGSPFKEMIRHYRNIIKDNKPLPHIYIPYLLDMHQKFSTLSHADISSFVHRFDTNKDNINPMLYFQYFQITENPSVQKIYFLNLLKSFVIILEIFADFLIHDQKIVSIDWKNELQNLGFFIEKKSRELQNNFPEIQI
ncbi:MAG: hypothetical protein A3J37_03855 [Alphaproteobacteria bacterium RIFCSPHIGHO2_12_FULL_45_9]|nr:MAG: hypothetical protein A3B66_06640 [Alphaproteobacteria bacterium RIFCSPHIGHO2_02_FULL_46_13]OFW94573.1 MAG: hypothetical protein A3J37_03855 [Alphaproteobacteria bacterium RIFCSPHIGHO2_12_FULL_45_9]